MAGDTALLVIDVQVGMFREANPVHRGKELLETLRGLIARARAGGVLVIYVQHSGAKTSFLAEGTPGWPIHPDIAPLPGDLIIHKRTPCSFCGTGLKEALDSRAIRNLVIAGIQSEMCVDTTTRSAFNFGYGVTLVEDAHTTFDRPYLPAEMISRHHSAVLGSWFAKLKKAREVSFQ